MPTVQDCMTRLLKLDDRLTAKYPTASLAEKNAITRCQNAIADVLKEIIRQDLHSRTEEIQKLSKTFTSAAAKLDGLKKAIVTIKTVFSTTTAIVNAAAAVSKVL